MMAKIIGFTACLLLLIAGLLFLWPSNQYALPVEHISEPSADSEIPDFALSKVASMYDRASLPAPTPPPESSAIHPVNTQPVHDPADDLRTWRYLGMANADGRIAGVFSNASQTRILKPGDNLEEFSLDALEAKTASFSLNGRTIDLFSPESIE